MELSCGDCSMVFHSTGLLQKHKALFCIGRKTSERLIRERQLSHGEKLKEMREMAEHHEHQLAQIHAHNQELELQREALAQQLGVLAGQSSTSHLESLLTELREQELRNEDTLQQLNEHLCALQIRDISVPAGQSNPGQNNKMHHATFDLISSVDGPLSTQIKALLLAYTQSGGSDATVLAQMFDLQAEAQTLEQNQPGAGAKARRKKLKPPLPGQSWELLAVEQENQRLEEEILRIQLARERHRGHEAAVRTELQLIQRENLHHQASLQAEMESLAREMERAREAPRHCRQPPPSAPPPPPPPPLPFSPQPALHPLAPLHAPLALTQTRSGSSPLGRHVADPLDCLGPAPYDPAAGFVIFYDLVLGVDATVRVLHLVAALYFGGQEAGRSTPLPPVQCRPGGALIYAHSLPPGNYALLSVKQPAPRIQPSPSLSLVVEVQAAGGLGVYGQEVENLVPWGWTRLDLFDQHNQLHSGHWRAPVRRLPVKPSLSPDQLNSVPQVGNMELCVRLVNARDGDVQSLVRSPLILTVQGNPGNLAISSPQPTGANQLPSLLTDQDPPFTKETNQS
ncbi:coiled-coil domain-containing protein 17 [Diretmus argenteus]